MRCHYIAVLFVFSALPLGSLAKPFSPRWDDIHVKHSWNAVPKNWVSLGHPPPNTTIDLYVALKPRHKNALIDTLYEVSNPQHPKYGAYLSKEQVAELTAPHPESLERINSWLEHHNIPPSSVSMTHGGSTLTIESVSVTQANGLLSASYQLYRHVKNNETIVRTISYALPAVLHRHVLTMSPTTSFFSPQTQWEAPDDRLVAEMEWDNSTSGEAAGMLSSRLTVSYLTPAFLQWLYDTSTYIPRAMDRNVLGTAGFADLYPRSTDLMAFMLKYRPDAVGASFSIVPVNGGGYDPTKPHKEPSLNLQWAGAMSYPTPNTFYSVGRGPTGKEDWFVGWILYMLAQKTIPQTVSATYGFDEDAISEEYALYTCDLFAELGARGVSIIVSSGNHGVGDGNCVTNSGSVQFRPKFPATCPYVTAVGGTTEYEPEIAASISGGGFSNYFERPPYQHFAVPTYLHLFGSQNLGHYNASSRGTPDVAAQAMNYPYILNNKLMQTSGTSGAAPVVAGIISLLNDWMLTNGLAPLGFLNPWLYATGFIGLIDITSGSNPGCNTQGFSAVPGWDPVTGLGTPSLGGLQEALIAILGSQHFGREEN